MLACRTAHIDYGITHATERSVDAYIGEFGYFLEREFLEITHKDYLALDGLRLEARQKLNKHKPASIGMAGRISGVTPADVNVLLIYAKRGFPAIQAKTEENA